jgi:hypothetical protein
MIKGLFPLIIFFAFSAMQLVIAQENRLVVLNLKTGYSVKGEIIEQTEQGVKIRTSDGEVFEYKVDEIVGTTNAELSSTTSKLFSSAKIVPKVLTKGDKVINLGIGFIKTFPRGNSEKLTIPPIPISFEYIVKDNLFDENSSLGLGGFIGYTSAKQDYWKYSRLILGARGYVHYALVEKLDTYAGIMLGYKSDVTKYSNSGTPDYKFTDGKPTLNMFAGCRYFFNDKIAGMAELSWGVSIFTLGVAVKL